MKRILFSVLFFDSVLGSIRGWVAVLVAATLVVPVMAPVMAMSAVKKIPSHMQNKSKKKAKPVVTKNRIARTC